VASTDGGDGARPRLSDARHLPLVSAQAGRAAGPNPWGATGLGWEIPSPPPTQNFDEIPVVRPVLTTSGDGGEEPACQRPRAAGHGGAAHPPLAHHFETLEQAAAIDVARDVGLPGHRDHVLGGLFAVYVVYAGTLFHRGFRCGEHHLNVRLGGINTRSLIASSFTMAMAVRGAQIGKRGATGRSSSS